MKTARAGTLDQKLKRQSQCSFLILVDTSDKFNDYL
jgi:hypothetical protein